MTTRARVAHVEMSGITVEEQIRALAGAGADGEAGGRACCEAPNVRRKSSRGMPIIEGYWNAT